MRITSLLLCGLAAVALGCGSGDGNTTPDLTVATVAITPASVDTLFSVGDSVKLTASAKDKSGAVVAGATISYSSSAAGVATVNDQGVVVAVSTGTATITATSKAVTSTVTIRVRQKLASATMAPSATQSVQITRTITVLVTGKDARGNTITGLPVPTYTSSNTNVATVSSMGVVAGAGLGQATITGTVTSTADGAKSASVVVTVQATPPSTATVTMGPMTFNPTQTEIAVGGTVTWSNTSGIQHDVDFGTGAAQHIAVWQEGTRSLTFATAGTFMYFCNLHGGMTGTIVVR